uniref:Polymeric immunoglobulin receptor-like 4.2 n=1 Tax=Sinocyclocheilus grahami TaxID=75366 RepID=A0A672SNK6_SINGR
MARPLILVGVLLYTAGETQKIRSTFKTWFYLCFYKLPCVTLYILESGSITIPCLYNSQYKPNSKYWCEGYFWHSCQITARANATGKRTITDYPALNVFTVKLNKLTSSDSGFYWCAVEIGSQSNPDDKKYLYVTVKSAPDVSVVSSSVSGHEGGDISVQCLYSSRYQNKLKRTIPLLMPQIQFHRSYCTVALYYLGENSP